MRSCVCLKFSCRNVSQTCQNQLHTILTPWLAWALSAGINSSACPIKDLPHQRLAPSKTCPIPVCIILSFTASKSGLWGFSTYFLRQHYALTCSTLVCTHCGRSSMRLHSLSGCVLGGSQPWLWLPHSALSPPPPPPRPPPDFTYFSVIVLWGLVHGPWHWLGITFWYSC